MGGQKHEILCGFYTGILAVRLALSHIIFSDSKVSILKEMLFEINPGLDISFCLHLEILWVSKLAVLAQPCQQLQCQWQKDNPLYWLDRASVNWHLMVMGIYTGLPLLATLKTLARFKLLENRANAEYFLLGTLLSILLGVSFGALFGWVLHY